MLQIISIITPLFLIIFASALFQKIMKLDENWSLVLNEYALKIGFPILIFSSLAKIPFSFSEHKELILSNSIFILTVLILTILLRMIFKFEKHFFRTIFICIIFSNVAYLGVPVLVQVFGEKILPVATLIVAIYLFWIFTFGIGVLDYALEINKLSIFKTVLNNLFKNPLLVSVLLGLIFAVIQIPIPTVVNKALDMITASVTPTVLVVIGLFIGKSKIGNFKEWIPVGVFSLITLFVLPAFFYFGIKMFGFQIERFSASIIQSAMPVAITPFALAEKFNLDKQFIARSIVLSTILSSISLSFWIWMI